MRTILIVIKFCGQLIGVMSVLEEQLEEQLQCAVCIDKCIDPKILQCYHVFCEKCLGHRRMVVQNEQGGRSLICPTCRHATPIPATGVSGLPSAFHFKTLLEILENSKKDVSSSRERDGASKIINPSEKVPLCPEHPKKELELYCQTCGKLICSTCGLRGGKHQSHDYEEAEKGFERYKEELTPSLKLMEMHMKIIIEALTDLETRRDEIFSQRELTEVSIHNTIGKLHDILDLRKAELIGQLHEITQRKLKNLAMQGDHLKTIQVQINSCLQFLKESLKTSTKREVLRMKTTIMEQVRELTAPFEPDILEPKTEANIATSFPPDLIEMCQNYGKVYTSLPNNSSKYDAMEKQLLSMKEVDERNGSGAEMHQRTMKEVDGGSIQANPPAAIKLLSKKLTRAIGGMNVPREIALGERGEVIVTESNEHCVSIFSSKGKKLLSFGKHGSHSGRFNYPEGVAVDGEGNIIVTDSQSRIQKFTASGQFLQATKDTQFSNLRGISFNSTNNKIYMVDYGNNQIQILNSDLTFSSTFGKKGFGNGEFRGPMGIACDSIGKVYVADTGNHRIQIFTAEGTFVRIFGKCGGSGGNLAYPVGIAIDANGLIYISDRSNHNIFVFSSESRYILTFGNNGGKAGEFDCPCGLAVNKEGLLYVVDAYNNRVQCFKINV